MIFKETRFKLKDGRDAVLRSPCEDDARAMRSFIIRASGETEYLMKCPEEHADLDEHYVAEVSPALIEDLERQLVVGFGVVGVVVEQKLRQSVVPV